MKGWGRAGQGRKGRTGTLLLGRCRAQRFRMRLHSVDHRRAHHSCQGTSGSSWSSCLHHLSHRKKRPGKCRWAGSGSGSAPGWPGSRGSCPPPGMLTALLRTPRQQPRSSSSPLSSASPRPAASARTPVTISGRQATPGAL